MNRYIGIREQLNTTIGRVSGDYEYEALPKLSQKLVEGWKLYENPIKNSIYAVQFFVRSLEDVANPAASYSEYKHVSFYKESDGVLPATEINQHLADGWKLYGNPYIGGSGYSQALVRSAPVSERPEPAPPASSSSSSSSSATPDRRGGKTRRSQKRIGRR